MITFLLAVVKLLVILCIVATIHEFGHFLAAKLFKIGVNEFSIGFGPKIFQKKKNETMYSLRWLPLGGYVMIEGEGEVSEKENSFSKKHPFKRIIVLCMGVIFNFILGVIILTSIAFFYPTQTTEITSLTEDSVLINSGIQVGDRITKIDGKKITFASELIKTKYTGEDNVTVEYVRDGKKETVLVENVTKEIGYVGIAFKVDNQTGTNVVDYTQTSSVAEAAGIKSDDIITAVNGVVTNNSVEVIKIVQQNAKKEVIFTINRNDEVIEITITPDVQKRFDLGVQGTKEEKTNIYYALANAYKTVEQVVSSYADLFKGNVGINDVSSVVGIGVVVSKTNGILEYLNMLALISLAVGAANILPFVPLDGGKIVLVIYEWITKKKPSEKFETILSLIGWGLLLMLTVVVTFKDVMSIF